ncbi:hypothetical protein ABZ897_61425 [Nonomuraea sp. NPDC046802]|uniref:hypothetical protein n=1 Tax=Nonomuraea sp. NPDC046802 TaxID=3154919 RepID=UPI0033D1EEE3
MRLHPGHEVGRLWLPSGTILFGDPAYLGGDGFFRVAARVEAGRYPVTWAPDGDAALVLREVETVRWEPQDPGEFYECLNSERTCFMDTRACEAFSSCEWLFEAAETWYTGPSVITDPATGHQVFGFFSGARAGAHRVWLGRAADGEPTRLVARHGKGSPLG